MTVRESVAVLLERLPAALSSGPEAALALALAESVDEPDSTTSKANAARELREVLGTLRAMAPPERTGVSKYDQLAAARQRRRNRATG